MKEVAVRQRLSRARRAFQQLYASESSEIAPLPALHLHMPATARKRQEREMLDRPQRKGITRKPLRSSVKPTLAREGRSRASATA